MNQKALSFLRLIRRFERGKLKIYLGYGAGVGKTYQMLLEGHQLKDEGVDVVIGLVEPHGRSDTAELVDGLEVIPRLRREYRGIALEEMDLDAVLARRPEIALIDELAHTNVPGSRHPKRYQDVQEILEAGIHVITTLNVQHLESLYDTVEAAVGVKVRERIPDSVVAEADQIVNVDLAPEDLRKRLLEGKIYPTDRIDMALNNFFANPNLEMLRELTLRELASQIDFRRRESEQEPDSKAPDQVMVCLSSRGPNSEMLLRYGSRLAGRLNRNWYAVYVQVPHEEPTVIDSRSQTLLSSTLTLAKELGALVFTYKGEDIVDTILNFAREYRVGHIVIGKPAPISLWRRLLGNRSVAERLLTEATGFTLVVLDTWKELGAVSGSGPQEPRDEPPVEIPTAKSTPLRLSALLEPSRVIVWEGLMSRDSAIRQLVDKATAATDHCDSAVALRAVLKREEEGSTFLTEGIAVPHARIEGLTQPLVALGLACEGLSDVPRSQPGQLVFLILSPTVDPDAQIRILSEVSNIGKDQGILKRLRDNLTPGQMIETIAVWETERFAGHDTSGNLWFKGE